jgi:hypothetical protein
MHNTPTLLVLVLFFLSGCNSNTAQALLDDYSNRMSNVLEIEIPTSNTLRQLPAFPEKRDRIVSTSDIRQGLWEVLDFRQCDMLSIISERNSTLGKVMPASQKMRYELRFIKALQECRELIAKAKNPDESQLKFQARLEEIYQTKKANLPAEIWNGIYTSAEINKHFKLAAKPFSVDSSADIDSITKIHRTLGRFTYLASLANAEESTIELPDWLDQIENEYATLHHSDFGSQVIATIPLLTSTLNQVAGAIEGRLMKKPFCFKGHKPKRATVLSNVFQTFYVKQVQPYMTLVEKAAKPWFVQNDFIFSQLPATNQMQEYSQQIFDLQNPSSLWNQWTEARDRHTKAWQTILGQCNMMPGM